MQHRVMSVSDDWKAVNERRRMVAMKGIDRLNGLNWRKHMKWRRKGGMGCWHTIVIT